MGQLTLSGNEITDAVRLAGVQGDGLTPPAGFGIWAAATNLVTNGGFESGTAAWTPDNSNVTIASVAAAAKFGTKGLSISEAGATQNKAYYKVSQAPGVGTVYTASVWAKGVGSTIGKTFSLQFYESVLPNSGPTPTIVVGTVTLTASFQRVTATMTLANGTMGVWINMGLNGNGAAGDVVYADGVQAETGAVATPYIETNGATASRPAANVTGPSSLLNATQGWMAFRFKVGMPQTSAGISPRMSSWGDDLTHRLSVYIDDTHQAGVVRQSPTGTDRAELTGSYALGDVITVVVAWTSSGVSISFNGSAFTTAGTGHVPTITSTVLNLGCYLDGGALCNGNMLWSVCGTGTLTSSDAATLNANGNTPPSLPTVQSQLPAAAAPTMAWQAVTGTYQSFKTAAAAATGTSTVTTNVVRVRSRTASTHGSSAVSASVVRTRSRSVSATGRSTVAAIVVRTRSRSATTTGRSTVTAAIVRLRARSAAAHGSSVVTASVTAYRRILPAQITGTSAVSCTVVRTRSFAGRVTGSSTIGVVLVVVRSTSGGGGGFDAGWLARMLPADEAVNDDEDEVAMLMTAGLI